MKKIIVTGATSMIGVATIEAAIEHDTEVYAIVRKNTSRMDRLPSSSKVHIFYGNLDRLEEITDLPETCDVFYHFAWIGTGKDERDNPTIQEKNIQYALEAVRLAKKCGCSRFVFAGSQAEYGTVDGEIDEDTIFSPKTSYGIAKYAAGALGKKLCEELGMEHVWGRIFSVYGPHDNDGTMLDYAIKCFENHETARFSASTQAWNYLYEGDAGQMFLRLGEDDVLPGTYLIAGNRTRPLKEYIQVLMDSFMDNVNAEFASEQIITAYGINVNNEKSLKAMAYTPQITFEEGIKKMIDARTSKNKSGGVSKTL